MHPLLMQPRGSRCEVFPLLLATAPRSSCAPACGHEQYSCAHAGPGVPSWPWSWHGSGPGSGAAPGSCMAGRAGPNHAPAAAQHCAAASCPELPPHGPQACPAGCMQLQARVWPLLQAVRRKPRAAIPSWPHGAMQCTGARRTSSRAASTTRTASSTCSPRASASAQRTSSC